jgi:hypothetical protein
MKRVQWAAVAAVAIGVLSCVGPAQATTKLVTIDTSALPAGTAAQFAWDVIGNGSDPCCAPNTVTISNFSTNGTVGTSSSTGNVVGSLPGPVSISDSLNFFNELLVNVTLGTTLSFKFSFTQNFPGLIPTGFSTFLLDPVTGLPLVHTSELGGSDALFLLSIDGTTPGGILDIFPAVQGIVTVSITDIAETPLPGALPLFATGAGLLGLVGWRRKRKIAIAV